MKTIGNWNNKELEIGLGFDKDEELEVTILDYDGHDKSIWLSEEQVRILINHLMKVCNEKP